MKDRFVHDADELCSAHADSTEAAQFGPLDLVGDVEVESVRTRRARARREDLA